MKAVFQILFSSFLGLPPSLALPYTPANPCPNHSCTETMKEVYQDFLTLGQPPLLQPMVYSGDCYFKSQNLNPNQPHRSMVFLDQHPEKDEFYFATGFTFFGARDKYADWTVETTRERVKGAWNNYGPIEIAEDTLRVVNRYENGNPAWIYYVRQNPLTSELYYITYWGGAAQISFCRLTPH